LFYWNFLSNSISPADLSASAQELVQKIQQAESCDSHLQAISKYEKEKSQVSKSIKAAESEGEKLQASSEELTQELERLKLEQLSLNEEATVEIDSSRLVSVVLLFTTISKQNCNPSRQLGYWFLFSLTFLVSAGTMRMNNMLKDVRLSFF